MTLSRRTLLKAGTAATVATAASLCGCGAVNPATGRQSFTGGVSPEDDIALGRGEHPKMLEAFGGEYQNAKLQRYVDTVGRRLAAFAEYQQFEYRFTLLNTPIVNAFALPGGYVYLSRGLLSLASSEAEMAGVLAHELGHVNARHTAERIGAQQIATIGVIASAIGASMLGLPADSIAQFGQTIAQLAIQGYSRQQELESDTLGIRYMSRAGYDPDAMVTFLSSMREQSQVEARSMGLPPGAVDQYNVMATHPRTVDRVRDAQAAAATQRVVNARIGREDYLRMIDGMLFGDDPEQGLIKGQRFIHPNLRFEFTVPDGFRIRNSPERVIAEDPNGATIVFDLAPIQQSRSMTQYLQAEWAGQTRLADVEALNVNGAQAATGRTVAQSNAGPVDLRLVAINRDGRSVYRLLFVSPRSRTAQLSTPFRKTTYSFRTISAAEANAARPLILQIRQARPGDRVERLADPLPYGPFNDDWFRVLNDLPPGAQPTPNQLLKTIQA